MARADDKETIHPAAKKRKQISWSAAIATVFLAGVGAWNLTFGRVEDTNEILWVGVLLLSSGTASLADLKTLIGK